MKHLRHLNTVQAWVAIATVLITGTWTYYRWQLSGGNDWMVNLDMATEVLPYSKDLRMLVVHVKSKNPTTSVVDFSRGLSTFTLSAKEIPPGLTPNKVIDFNHARQLVPTIDLMADDGDGITYMPGAEFDDMITLVVKGSSSVYLNAQLARKEGFRTQSDFVSVERIIQIVDKPDTSRPQSR